MHISVMFYLVLCVLFCFVLFVCCCCFVVVVCLFVFFLLFLGVFNYLLLNTRTVE